MGKKYLIPEVIIIVAIGLIAGCIGEENKTSEDKQKTIMAFCGSASKPAIEEAAKTFEEKTSIKVELQFSGSGNMLSQMKLSKQGDLYIPGSPDYMEIAKRDNVVYPETVKKIAYIVPVINVQKGNPKKIQSLDDLANKGMEIGICAPESCCIGLYAVEILEYNNMTEKVKPNIVTHAESCSKTAALVVMDKVDAVIGWRVFSEWTPEDT